MSAWLSQDHIADDAILPCSTGTERALRLFDLLLAAAALVLLALPLAVLRRRAVSQPVRGRHGVVFDRVRLQLPARLPGRVLALLGAANWPVALHVARGEMAWVGPRPRGLDESAAPMSTRVRPGIVNPWFIRQRTAVHFGTEAQADLHYLAQRSITHDIGLLLRGMLVALLPLPAAVIPQRVQVGDVWFDNLDMGEALQRLRAMLDSGRSHQASFVNPACVNIAVRDRGYRRTLARAALVLPDGIGIKIGSAILGTPLKQNVNGTDLFPRLCELLQARGSSVFLLGGQPGIADAVAAEISRRWPGLRVAGSRHGYFDVTEEGRVAAEVRASGAEVLLVARGVPSQDLFIDRYLPLLGAPLAIGVGGLFDFVSGRISRAPMWMRETGLEWIWRLMQEPGRMWRRYLVGNVTFLGRVALQRLGLRKPARDTVPPSTAMPALPSVRAVVFATDIAGTELPLPSPTLLATLPIGHQTLIEHMLEQLAHAAVPDVDIVVSEQPEQLREIIGDGARWGLRVRWHLAKDPGRPYGALATAARATCGRVLVLHADRMPTHAALLRLTERNHIEMLARCDAGPCWTGAASAPAEMLAQVTNDLDRAALARLLHAQTLPVELADPDAACGLASASDLLAAQRRVLGDADPQHVPASWIRTAWGAMSPLARVEPGAVITGPVIVGPGCWVVRGAAVGPHVVLSADVVVSPGTQVRDSLVLPRTYIGSELEVTDAIVNGSRLRHVGLGVETTLAESDGLMLQLARRRPRRAGLPSRAAAGIALTAVAPLLLAYVILRRRRGQAPAWTRRAVVVGRDAATRRLQIESLLCVQTGGRQRDAAWATLAGLVDVVAGRRCWLGMRPRSQSQWYALRPEWQEVLASTPVGLLYAPAWADDADDLFDAQAVADVFGATRSQSTALWQWFAAAWTCKRLPRDRLLQNAQVRFR